MRDQCLNRLQTVAPTHNWQYSTPAVAKYTTRVQPQPPATHHTPPQPHCPHPHTPPPGAYPWDDRLEQQRQHRVQNTQVKLRDLGRREQLLERIFDSPRRQEKVGVPVITVMQAVPQRLEKEQEQSLCGFIRLC